MRKGGGGGNWDLVVNLLLCLLGYIPGESEEREGEKKRGEGRKDELTFFLSRLS